MQFLVGNRGAPHWWRDGYGDGIYEQSEARISNADGGTSVAVADVNPDGSLTGKVTTKVIANGHVRTVETDAGGNCPDSENAEASDAARCFLPAPSPPRSAPRTSSRTTAAARCGRPASGRPARHA